MPPPVLSDDSLAASLDATNADVAANVELCLYQNDVTPTEATVLADLTPCDFANYSPIPLDFWNAPTVAAHVASATRPQAVFEFIGPGTGNNVYGYYWRHTVTNKALWIRRFDVAPLLMTADGDKIKIDLTDTFEAA